MLGRKLVEASESYSASCESVKLYNVEYRRMISGHEHELSEVTARHAEEVEKLSKAWESRMSGYDDAKVFVERLQYILRIVNSVFCKKLILSAREDMLKNPDLRWVPGLSRGNLFLHSVSDSLISFNRKDGSRFWVPKFLFHSSDRDIAKWARSVVREYQVGLNRKKVQELESQLVEAKESLRLKNEEIATLEKRQNRLTRK